MNVFKEKYGPWAIVTGASAGLGAEFARQLADRELNLVLVARREEKLESLAKELEQQYNIDTKIVVADLVDEKSIKKIENETSKLDIGLLVNNAGFGISGDFLDTELKSELNMLKVNCIAPTLLTHIFGNKMKERNKGGIIFLASLVAFAGLPTMSHYSATKAWNLMLGEGMYFECQKYGIDVLSLCPGATKSEFADIAGMNTAFAMKTEPVVRLGLNTLGSRPVIIAGLRNKLMYYSMRGLGRRLRSLIIGAVMKSYLRR